MKTKSKVITLRPESCGKVVQPDESNSQNKWFQNLGTFGR